MNKNILNAILIFSILIFLSWIFSNILAYFAISIVLSSILSPLVSYLYQLQIFGQHIPRFIAVIFSFAILVFFVVLFVLLFVPLITEQVNTIENIDYEYVYQKIVPTLSRIESLMIAYELTDKEPGFIVKSVRDSITSFFNATNIQEIVNSLLSFTGNFFISLLAIFFITFVLLLEKGILRKQFIRLIPNQYFEVSISAIYKIETLLSNYLLGLLLQMFSIFCLASLGLSILGVRYAITIAVFAAVANIIPYAGPILGASFGLIVGFSTLEFGDITAQEFLFFAVKVILVFSIVQITDNVLLQPVIFSKSVKAHPLEIFVIIFVGATLAGIIGMICAIPIYTVLRVVLSELYKGYNAYHIFKPGVGDTL